MHGLSEKQFKSETIFDLNNNMRQIKLKLVETIDQFMTTYTLPYMGKINILPIY